MQTHIQIERDGHGLQQAVLSLFEESLVRHRNRTAMERAKDDPETLDALESEIPERELTPGYFARASYLIDLQNKIEMRFPMDAATLTEADWIGVRAVATARAEFEREHPGCPRCGERQDNRHMRVCPFCNYQIRGKDS